MYDQLYKYIEHFLSQLLCEFHKAHSTQHALFKLLQKWQKELDSGGTCQKPMTAYLMIY